MYNVDSFWIRLKDLLKSKGITMIQLSKMMGYSDTTYTVKHATGNLPTTKDIIRICEEFNVSADYLLFGKETETNELVKQLNELPENIKNPIIQFIKVMIENHRKDTLN